MHHRSRHTPAARALLSGALFVLLAGCMQDYEETPKFTALETARIDPPAGARDGSCWARDVTPAVIETQTERVQVAPRSYSLDGKTEFPAQYETRLYPEIVEPRRVFEFETVCAEDITPEFIASLQRALQVRGLYFHEATGVFDEPTDAALRAFQRSQGVETGLLTIETARAFGLAPAVFD